MQNKLTINKHVNSKNLKHMYICTYVNILKFLNHISYMHTYMYAYIFNLTCL